MNTQSGAVVVVPGSDPQAYPGPGRDHWRVKARHDRGPGTLWGFVSDNSRQMERSTAEEFARVLIPLKQIAFPECQFAIVRCSSKGRAIGQLVFINSASP